MMFRPTAVVKPASAADSISMELVARPLGPFSTLGLSAWCGLVSGLLEVAMIVLRKHTIDPSRLYGMSRHFLWVIPMTNVCLFLGLGLTLCLVASVRPRLANWLAVRLLGALALLPSLLVAFPKIYGLAWLVILLGVATNVAPLLERRAAAFRRLARVSFPAAALLVLFLAACLWGGDRLKEWRERARPLPDVRSANVILIVLDAVAAGHMNLYGYGRPPSPTLVEMAERGIRFDFAQSTCSWTLPSHASMFTGRWPHELSASWRTPLDRTYPTLAEFLSLHGYATAGFVANTQYCARDSGLDRGFTEYHDFVFPHLAALRMAVLVNRALQGLRWLDGVLENYLDLSPSQLSGSYISWLLISDRKEAQTVNDQFLQWLARRSPDRPFFAFLNYFDAHWPYELPRERMHRFGIGPRNEHQRSLIENWWSLDKHGVSSQDLGFVYDSYDDCVADLDEQLGRLFDELDRRDDRERTWVIVVSDHGESFGEHPGVYCHGTSLYQTELHVPLLIIPPAKTASKRIVTETVSLRDLATTVVDLTGLKARCPFPGDSLAQFWNGMQATAGAEPLSSQQALSEVVPSDAINPDPSPISERNWPMAALVEQGWSYIRRDTDAREELFRLPEDSNEQHNLAASPGARATLERMRTALSQLTAGPLTSQRFKP
jgi:arylsulfatase A-like enzyme